MVSENMWDLYYKFIHIFKNEEGEEIDLENVSTLVSFFQNCIGYGTQNFFVLSLGEDTPYKLLLQLIKEVLDKDKIENNVYNSFEAMRLINTMLENYIGQLDHVFSFIIQLIHSELKSSKSTPKYKFYLFQVFCACFNHS
mmetsp:Transcript_24527/g.21770  ORF Transcript_24527/g.21770 Transcript_24527/m.21770 type:complete len:140 (+) Transcript_24527:1423-1842(+)